MITYDEYARIRSEKGLKDSEVAKAANIPQSTFSDWKKGKSTPKAEKAQKIADALGVPLSLLMGLSDINDEDSLLEAYMQNEETKEFVELFQGANPAIRDAVVEILKSSQHNP